MRDPELACETCLDTGEVCINCEEARGECLCADGPVYDTCPECGDDA